MLYPDMTFPRMIEVKQKFQLIRLEDYAEKIRMELRGANLKERIRPGARIAITAGSRGIAHYSEILRIVVEEVRKVGGEPFLVPAMGSHGGATAEGQVALLRDLGITAESVGAPIVSSMDVEVIGKVGGGVPVYIDRNALKADGIIVVARVKPHTDFKGRIESGLMKMLAIGLGKQKGAETIHRFYREGYHKILPEAAKLVLRKAPVILGLAILENSCHEIAKIKAVEPEMFETEEERLLEEAKALMGRLPFKEIDVLIVDEIGKDVSGMGMDTNVTGRFWLPGESDPNAPMIRRIVVLGLTEKTHGNALGIGLADFTTETVFKKIDFQTTYINALTSGHPEVAKIPIFLPTERDAIAAALHTCGPVDPKEAKVVRVRNTMELERLWISESLLKIVESEPTLRDRIEVIGNLKEMHFDEFGMLKRLHNI
ncbi:MAG: lactate racemase domain-containing protein [Nitrososphaerota archaeon]|nr:DUF362 domain-containing protein [Candidatus Bathyarchaeota archaeon]MDW8048192.1 lactate racemase domain-containing protein [Nitrososphaerota archaeon]